MSTVYAGRRARPKAKSNESVPYLIYRLIFGSETLHRQADSFDLAGKVIAKARAHPRVSLVVAFVAFAYLPRALILAPMVVAVAVAGYVNFAERRKIERKAPELVVDPDAAPVKMPYLNSRRIAAGTLLLVGAIVVGSIVLPKFFVALVALVGIGFLIKMRGKAVKGWYAHDEFVGLLLEAEVLKPRADGKPLTVLYRGGVQSDAFGERIKVTLPGAVPYTVAVEKQLKLAAGLDVAPNLLRVTHDEDDPASTMTFWRGKPRAVETVSSPLLDLAGPHDAREPLRIGTDEYGKPVLEAIAEENCLAAGNMGSGKTSYVRAKVLHFAFDPAADIYGLDGKGSRADYADVAAMARRWVWGTDDDAFEQALSMLTEVYDVIRERNANDLDTVHSPILLILEELQEIRASAPDEKARKSLDKIIGQIERLGRVPGVHVQISTQRPSVEDTPSSFRNIINTRLCLRGTPADAKLILAASPTIPLPTRPGRAVFSGSGIAGHKAVVLDWIPLDAFRAALARAANLRAGVDAPVHAPFAAAVIDALANGPKTTTELAAVLPVQYRDTPVALGKRISREVSVAAKGSVGKRPVWRLDQACKPSARESAHADRRKVSVAP